MRHSLPTIPQFYVTAPQPCPYLSGRVERKLFTALQGEQSEAMNNALSKQGFRRSQNVLYRPSCADCCACLSARIRVADFIPSRNQRKAINRNRDLSREVTSAWANEEQFDLFRRYLDSRHSDGGMADMDLFEYAAMIEETPVRSRVIEYRGGDPDTPRGLSAVCLTDVLDDGLSLVYSFFDPSLDRRSPGSFMILDHIELARAAGLPYVYLGYWVPGSPKMHYKARFSALEVYHEGAWNDLGDPESYTGATHPLSVPPIAEQVTRLVFPQEISSPVTPGGPVSRRKAPHRP